MNAWLDLNKSQACHMDRQCARVLGGQQRLGCVRVRVLCGQCRL